MQYNQVVGFRLPALLAYGLFLLTALGVVSPAPLVQQVEAENTASTQADTTAWSATGSHDWRSPGYVSVVGGRLFDRYCVPLQSVGSNVPNLPYRPGVEENLEWMRVNGFRWMRVFATGHDLAQDRAPRDAAQAANALRRLLGQVERFNAAHLPHEAIYVLVSLTDYYQSGVPGDRQAFDNPIFRESPVLPAPWYRAGVPTFDFEQEHGFGWLHGLPSYEVNYKPWVREIVSAAVSSTALMGWQLGNELKARNSLRNSITPIQAYEWYRAFTADMVDTIRAIDRNHLIATGVQYIAELVDWGYRPHSDPDPALVPEYRRLVSQMLDACAEHCWNLAPLTVYDFNLYPFDDAASFAQTGAATIITEYGFTRGSPAEMQRRFGGDRAAALSNGLDRRWTALDGTAQRRMPGIGDLVQRYNVSGVAPWGTPAPEPYAGFDADGDRGVTSAPDENALWSAWRAVAGRLEMANRTAGPSQDCLAFDSTVASPTAPDAVPPDARSETPAEEPTSEEPDGS